MKFILFSTQFVTLLSGVTTYLSIHYSWGSVVTRDLFFYFIASVLFFSYVHITDLKSKYDDLHDRFQAMAEDFDLHFNNSSSDYTDTDTESESVTDDEEIPLKKNGIETLLKEISGKDVDLGEITTKICEEFTNTFKDSLKKQCGSSPEVIDNLFATLGDTIKTMGVGNDTDSFTKAMNTVFGTDSSKDKGE